MTEAKRQRKRLEREREGGGGGGKIIKIRLMWAFGFKGQRANGVESNWRFACGE